MTTQVKIIRTIATEKYGSLSDGDILRTNREFAKYLVDECNAAQYIGNPQQPQGAKILKKDKKESNK